MMGVELIVWQVVRLIVGVAIIAFTARYDLRGRVAQSGALAIFAAVALIATSVVGLAVRTQDNVTVQWLPRFGLLVLATAWCKWLWIKRDCIGGAR